MGMTSITEVYKIGHGPSSSHTMAPEKGARYMLEKYPDADSFKVKLLGSLSKTGKGHRTDYALKMTFGNIPCEIIWDDDSEENIPHPNTMKVIAIKDGEEIGHQTFLSVGGGAIQLEGQPIGEPLDVYNEDTYDEIAKLCRRESMTIPEYVYANEPDAREHLTAVWRQMQQTIESGIHEEGILPGGLYLRRRGKEFYGLAQRERDMTMKENFMIAAYAYAASEENAAGGRMVTAPTCGASGVLPAVLFYEKTFYGRTDEEIIDALAVAGIIGLLIKTNASISGAEAGCQAEVGSACSMAAAAIVSMRHHDLAKIEAAAEIAMEHCLGLTCDPVDGLVQIPCIERNAVGALRAHTASMLAEVIYENRKVSFDLIVKTMYETGRDISKCYKETSEGGLAMTLHKYRG